MVQGKNPIDFEGHWLKVKVTGVKTLSFLAHFRLVRAKSRILLHGIQLKCIYISYYDQVRTLLNL